MCGVDQWQKKVGAAPITASLIAAVVVIYLLQLLLAALGRPLDISDWSLSRNGLLQGSWWSLFTHLFLHFSFLHLFANVLALWFVGPEVEMLLGRAKFLLLYFASGLAGGLLQIAFAPPMSELIGSSGAVCGVLLSFTTAYPNLPLRALLFFILPVRMKAKTLGRGLIVFSLLCALLKILPQIGHLAHLGGALTGAALTWGWLRQTKQTYLMARDGQPKTSTDALLERVLKEGMDGLSPSERQQLENLTKKDGRRRRW